MTLRKFALYAFTLPFLVGVIACNSDYVPSEMTASSAAVRSFSLTADDSILANLDSVYFSIDLTNYQIFNADSLPYGTKVTNLIPVIKMLETPKTVELKVTRENGTDTTYNYLTNSTDSIDFTNPVTLRVVSYDGLTEINYTVKVNVHKLVSDSLTWSKENKSVLPSSLTNPSAQRTAQKGSTFYCLTASNGSYSLASYESTTIPTNGAELKLEDWETQTVSFDFTPQVESFSATESQLFILSENGDLYSSEDGKSWSATGCNWHYIYGEYDGQIIGSVETSNGWVMESYPERNSASLPSEMPVEGSSMPVSYIFPMSTMPQMVIVGGRDASGNLSRGTWSFDGTGWTRISRRSLPEAAEGIALAMYYSFKTLSSWNVVTYPTLIAFGGKNAQGEVSPTVYISKDFGVNWDKASSLMQLPDYIPATFGSQLFVVDSYYSSTVKPMIAKPTEIWACPYIYLFGGYNQDNIFQNAIWRGVINRLSFAPIE